MKKIKAEIIADSIDNKGNRITSYILTYPRFIHGELMTHRMFSRNSASSRAIPFNKVLKMVEEDPFIPIAWQKHHKGMQGNKYITDKKISDFKKGVWLNARNKVIQSAKELYENLSVIKKGTINEIIGSVIEDTGVTKQLCNRLLEPFMWHTVLVTATEFENFFKLRSPSYLVGGGKLNKRLKPFKSKKDAIWKYPELKELTDLEWLEHDESQAEIHIQALAEAMWDAKNESIPKELKPGEWHIPFGDKISYSNDIDYTTTKVDDIDFHRSRQMFIIKDGEVILAEKGTSKSHTEYFGDVTDIVRGFRLNGTVYTYMNNFTPVESGIVQQYFEDCTCIAGAKDFFNYIYGENPLIKIASARCARLSYMTFDNNTDYQKDIELHDHLLKSGHMSPFEHCARVMSDNEYDIFFKGTLEYDSSGLNKELVGTSNEDMHGWCSNFKGFIPYRYLLENNYA